MELVTINGDLVYGRPDWIAQMVGNDAVAELETLLAWGKPMLLDTRYVVNAIEAPRPRLATLRSELIASYPQVGPIFA
jgi:5-methylthioadenosine/S-adenosylhomocysteine deaminase